MGESTKITKLETQSAAQPESKKRSITQVDGETETQENILENSTEVNTTNEESSQGTKRTKVDTLATDKNLNSTSSEITEKTGEQTTTAEQPTETKTVSTATTDSKDEKPKEMASRPTFVFGSSTSFGSASGFGMFGGKSVFGGSSSSSPAVSADATATATATATVTATSEKTQNNNTETDMETKAKAKAKTEPEPEATKKSIFGSSSTFGSAFSAQTLTAKSIFDKSNEKSTTDNGSENTETDKKDHQKNKEVYQTVHLEKQKVKSGEENEETIFQVKAKLYHMDLKKVSDGWKERGIGILKLNKFVKPESDHYNARLVMRQDGILKLILNVPIIKDFKVYKGMASSLSSDKFVRFQGVENGDLVQYALKIGQVENASTLFNHIEEYIPK